MLTNGELTKVVREQALEIERLKTRLQRALDRSERMESTFHRYFEDLVDRLPQHTPVLTLPKGVGLVPDKRVFMQRLKDLKPKMPWSS